MSESEPGARPPRPAPLDGIRVVDLTSVVFGTYATQMLGDLGADVIKVESPQATGGGGLGGDILRWAGHTPEGAPDDLGPIFLTLNRNKRSVLLDLGRPAAARAMRRLLAGADVFVSNVRYEGLRRLGLAYEDVRTLRADVVYAHAAGYGSDGPYAGLPAYDDLIQAASGLADLQGRVDGDPTPRYAPMLLADKTSGLFLVQAVLAALFHRQRTGQGQFVEVPMLECVTSFVLAEHLYGHAYEPPTGPWGYRRALSPHRRPYRTLDGWIGLLPYSDRQWDDFFAVAGRPGALQADPRFATYTARSHHIDELYALIEDVTATRTTDDWLALLGPMSIPAARMNRLDDLPDDPHLRSVGFFEAREHPDSSPYNALRPPLRFAETPASIRRDAPRLGAHTREVLIEAGVAGDDLETLADEAEALTAPRPSTPSATARTGS